MSKRILITGASRGMGLAATRRLLELGFNVIATCRKRGEEVLAGLKERFPGSLEVMPLDLLHPSHIEQLGAELLKRAERGIFLDVLIHNSGVYPGGKYPEYDKKRLMAVNFFGPLQLTRLLLPAMAKGGRVIFLSSGLGRLSRFSSGAAQALLETAAIKEVETLAGRYLKEGSLPGWPEDAYGVSKALLNTLTRALSAQYGDFIFAAIDPGWVRTDMGGEGAPNSLEQGIETTIWAATTSQLSSNAFYHHCQKTDW